MNSFRRSLLIYAALAVALAAQSGSPKLTNRKLATSAEESISAATTGTMTGRAFIGTSSGQAWTTSSGTGTITANGSGLIMFTATSRPVPSGPPVTLAQVKMSAALLNRSALPSSSYLKAAASIGLNSAATDEARILQTIDMLGLTVYDFGKVDNYLYREAKKQGESVNWVWKPLRDEDQDAIKDSGRSMGNRSGTVWNTVYANLIPEQVLGKAAAIMEAMPGVVFLVTDYEAVKPDPFLAITTIKLLAEGKLWIVEQWDEPGFGSPPARSVTPANQRVAYNVIVE